MTKKLRILFNSNAPWSTSGYGTQMYDLLPQVVKEGYPTAQIAFYGLEGGKLSLDNVTFYPRIADVWGNDSMPIWGDDFNADVTITLQDIWVLDPNVLKNLRRWIAYVPIDHDPVPPPIVERLRLAYRIVTYSQFGYNELKRVGLHSTYIPHGVDTTVFKPQKKQEARKMFNLPQDVYLFGMVGANKDNPPRKSFQEAMEAFKMYHDRHPKSAIYFHTLLDQQNGFPIHEYAKFLGIQDVVFHIPPKNQLFDIDRAKLATIYNMFDCLLEPSRNEGFGVPIIEAQACGVPVIVNNITAMPELVIEGVTGEICEVATKAFTPLLSYVGVPSVRSLYDKMEHITKHYTEKNSQLAREFVVKNYDHKTVFQTKWKPFFELLEKEVYPKT